MSLDIYLVVRQTCPHCGKRFTSDSEGRVHDQNITHNLNNMAEEAGLYGLLWRPEENGIETAEQLIEPLQRGIAAMEADPERFKKHNARNGWGLYEHFVPWLKELLKACEENPECGVYASR